MVNCRVRDRSPHGPRRAPRGSGGNRLSGWNESPARRGRPFSADLPFFAHAFFQDGLTRPVRAVKSSEPRDTAPKSVRHELRAADLNKQETGCGRGGRNPKFKTTSQRELSMSRSATTSHQMTFLESPMLIALFVLGGGRDRRRGAARSGNVRTGATALVGRALS